MRYTVLLLALLTSHSLGADCAPPEAAHQALLVHLETLENVLYKWQAKHLMAELRFKESERLSQQVRFYERLCLAAETERFRAIAAGATTNALNRLSTVARELDDKRRSAEDDVIEYSRLHGLPRQPLAVTQHVLPKLRLRQANLTIRVQILQAQHPQLTNMPPAAARQLGRLTAETLAEFTDEESEAQASEEANRAAGN